MPESPRLQPSPERHIVPKIVEFERLIGSYHFEGGGFVYVVAAGSVATSCILDAVQEIVRLKRAEIGTPLDGAAEVASWGCAGDA